MRIIPVAPRYRSSHWYYPTIYPLARHFRSSPASFQSASRLYYCSAMPRLFFLHHIMQESVYKNFTKNFTDSFTEFFTICEKICEKFTELSFFVKKFTGWRMIKNSSQHVLEKLHLHVRYLKRKTRFLRNTHTMATSLNM